MKCSFIRKTFVLILFKKHNSYKTAFAQMKIMLYIISYEVNGCQSKIVPEYIKFIEWWNYFVHMWFLNYAIFKCIVPYYRNTDMYKEWYYKHQHAHCSNLNNKMIKIALKYPVKYSLIYSLTSLPNLPPSKINTLQNLYLAFP